MKSCVGVSGLAGNRTCPIRCFFAEVSHERPPSRLHQADNFNTSDLMAYFDKFLRGRISDRGSGFI